MRMSYNIAVLRGGPSSEYDISLKSGAAVLRTLGDATDHTLYDILIDRDGQWYRNGRPTTPARALHGADVALIAMHGEYGEDGELQRLLDTLGVPYTGTHAYASALAMHKPRARFQVAALPMIKLPGHYVVRADDGDDYNAVARDIFARFGPPYIVKPAARGSSIGLTVAKTLAELPDAIRRTRRIAGMPVVVEEFISGREATCGVIEQFRGQDLYALPPVEIVHRGGKTLFDYEAKYSTDEQVTSTCHCPATFSKEEKHAIEEAAKAVHRALDLNHYSRSDFILTAHGLYFLEANSLPDLSERSRMALALETIGSNLREFLEHITTLAVKHT